MTQEEKIKDLEERIAIIQATNSELCADLDHWKKVAAGQKGRMQQLAQDVERWKAYGKEADELNEKRIGKIEELEKVIEGLNSQVKTINVNIFVELNIWIVFFTAHLCSFVFSSLFQGHIFCSQ